MGQPVVHFEIGTRNNEQSKQFYSALFDWEIQSSGPATMIATGSPEGIQGNISQPESKPKNYVTIYVQESDVNASLLQVEKLGGKVLVPASEVPRMDSSRGSPTWITMPLVSGNPPENPLNTQ